MNIRLDFCSVSERDMDILFLTLFTTDNDFTKLFLDKTDIKCDSFTVENVILSKADNDGESDLTVILNIDGKRIAFLIEDKINARAMDKQCDRYSIRGKKGIENGDYEDFKVFIICPEKYYELNNEAKNYDYHVSYEECLSHISKVNNPIYQVYTQQIKQAIEKARHQSNTTFNENANKFFQKYVEYKNQKFGDLDLATNPDLANGYWPDFRTSIKGIKITHKIDKGNVDLTIPGISEKNSDMKLLEIYLKNNGYKEIEIVPTGKSIAIRINVTKFLLTEYFSDEMYPIFDECFRAIKKLETLADFFDTVLRIFK